MPHGSDNLGEIRGYVSHQVIQTGKKHKEIKNFLAGRGITLGEISDYPRNFQEILDKTLVSYITKKNY